MRSCWKAFYAVQMVSRAEWETLGGFLWECEFRSSSCTQLLLEGVVAELVSAYLGLVY